MTGFLVLAALYLGLVRHQAALAPSLFVVAIAESLMVPFILRQPQSRGGDLSA